MICDRCGGDSRVIDSRCHNGRHVTRRRVCRDCRLRWTTYERHAEDNIEEIIVFDQMLSALDRRDFRLLQAMVRQMLRIDHQQGDQQQRDEQVTVDVH